MAGVLFIILRVSALDKLIKLKKKHTHNLQNSAPLIQKTGLRSRLIFACLVVALLVASIYVTVSYRLTSDANTATELKAMSRVVLLLNNTFLKDTFTYHYNVEDFVANFNKVEADIPHVFIIQSDKVNWSHSHLVDESTVTLLVNTIATEHYSGENLISIGDANYLWQMHEAETHRVIYIQRTTLLDTSLRLVGKRLLITSVIVFWIAIWLALTLSSFIASRAEEINKALTNLATRDSLTGLHNRLYLNDTLAKSICKVSNSKRVEQGCILAIDLDKFKDVNDAFGHSAGDKLLVEVSMRLQNVVSKDCEAVRIGGDEFIVWAPGFTLTEGENLAKEIIHTFNKTILIDGLEVDTGASIGVAHFPTHTDNAETLISCADTAMYKAKKQRSGWQTYNEAHILKSELDVRLRTDLHNAMLHDEFTLHFQPKVDLRTHKVIGVEGLCRWQHEQLGLLMPAAFIELIDHSGKVQDFGRYILRKAVTHAAHWKKLNIAVPIAINLSPYNLLDPGLIDYIKQLLDDFDIPAHYIEIELTENETCLNIDYIQSALQRIKEIGIEVAIDDFGTGMSSFAYLDKLRANTLKIDRTFVSDIDINDGHKAIVSSAVTLVKAFGCNLVAEGVETKQQAELLVELGCYLAQGYYIAKPMPEEALISLLKQLD